MRRNGCQEVTVPRSTDEAGEPPEGPCGGKGVTISRTVGGIHARYTET